MRLSRRVVLVWSAVFLACYSGLAVAGAARLRYAGGEYLYAAAALLALAAVGLALGDLAARAFAILLFAATALGYGAVAIVAGRHAWSESGRGDWAALGGILLGFVALLALAGCAKSLSLGVALLLLGRSEKAPGYQAHTVAWLLGACGVAALAWILGYQGWYRELPVQDACLGGGSAGRCDDLARNEHFSPEEQLAFARRGCERGHADSCAVLAARIGKEGGAGEEAKLLASQCERGNIDVCLRYGKYLLSVAHDAAAADAALARVCAKQANRCSQAAQVAEHAGDAALEIRLLEAGCQRDDPHSCRRLLRRLERSKAPELETLRMRVCLLTDVNECLPLIKRDAAGVCPTICDSSEVNRMQSCDYCGRQAAAAGERALAERWWSANCEKGHQLSCANLEKTRAR